MFTHLLYQCTFLDDCFAKEQLKRGAAKHHSRGPFHTSCCIHAYKLFTMRKHGRVEAQVKLTQSTRPQSQAPAQSSGRNCAGKAARAPGQPAFLL